MGLMILFAISFQSVHSFEHLKKQFSEKECIHVYHKHKTEINHSHYDFEKCFVCDFTFHPSSFDFKEQFQFIVKNFWPFSNSNYCLKINDFFIGKNFRLRAPPIFMV